MVNDGLNLKMLVKIDGEDGAGSGARLKPGYSDVMFRSQEI